MRILHFTSTLAVSAGGPARSVLDNSKALAEAGLAVEILSHRTGTIDLPWTGDPPANLRLTLAAPPRWSRLASRDLRRQLPDRLAAGDILHLHGLWQSPNNLAARLARRLGKPYVVSIRGMLDPWSVSQHPTRKRLWYRLLERRLLQHAAVIHFTAAAELAKARPWLPPGVRTEIVPNIINLALFQDLPPRDAAHALFPQIPAGAPWVLFLSRIHEKKGLNFLIEAFARLPEPFRHAQLVIAGTGEPACLDALKRQTQQLALQSRVHFVGMVQGPAKVALYRTAAVLAIPTSQENFGLVFPEALACETPVMLTTGVDIHAEILAANAGYLITQDPENIRAALVEALSHPAENRQKGEAGRRWVLETLQPAAIAQRWKAIYESIL